MTLAELTEQRQSLWFRPVRTIDDAREFIASVGFCLIYPVKPPVVAPTFIGAVLGMNEELPTAKQAPLDARTRVADELITHLLAEKTAFEVDFGGEGSLLVAAAEFPYFYALMGDRNPKQPPALGVHSEKTLLAHTFSALQQSPANESQLLMRLGKSISDSALRRTLQQLWSQLRVVRHASGPDGSVLWEVLYDWAPQSVRQGVQISALAALSALVSRYIGLVIAAEPREIEDFFGRITAKSKVMEILKTLAAAREFQELQVDGKRMLQVSLPAVEMKHPAGKAPQDLHASHQQNEKRRHQPRPQRRTPGR